MENLSLEDLMKVLGKDALAKLMELSKKKDKETDLKIEETKLVEKPAENSEEKVSKDPITKDLNKEIEKIDEERKEIDEQANNGKEDMKVIESDKETEENQEPQKVSTIPEKTEERDLSKFYLLKYYGRFHKIKLYMIDGQYYYESVDGDIVFESNDKKQGYYRLDKTVYSFNEDYIGRKEVFNQKKITKTNEKKTPDMRKHCKLCYNLPNYSKHTYKKCPKNPNNVSSPIKTKPNKKRKREIIKTVAKEQITLGKIKLDKTDKYLKKGTLMLLKRKKRTREEGLYLLKMLKDEYLNSL